MRGILGISISYSVLSAVVVPLNAIPAVKYSLLAILVLICIVRRDALTAEIRDFIARMR